jgi:hypothetical protein
LLSREAGNGRCGERKKSERPAAAPSFAAPGNNYADFSPAITLSGVNGTERIRMPSAS